MIQTPNYGLPQFAEQDLFNVENFNEAFNKIDRAVSDIQETFNINGSGSDLTTQEVVVARGGTQTLNDRFVSNEAFIRSYTEVPQCTIPEKKQKNGSTSTIVTKIDSQTLQVIQKTNKGYMKYIINDKYCVPSDNSNYGGTAQLKRLVDARNMINCCIYKDAGTPSVGTLTTYTAPALGTNTVEATVMDMTNKQDNRSISSKTGNLGFGVYSIKYNTSVEYVMNYTMNGKANILYMPTSGSVDNVNIYVGNTLVKSFNPKLLASLTSVGIVEFDVPTKPQTATYNLKIEATGNAGLFYIACINFCELKNYKGQDVDNWKAYGSANGVSYVTTGANDYAMADENSKWFGSYHGGETLDSCQVLWINTNRFVKRESDLTYISFSDIPIKEWKIFDKQFDMRQRTTLLGKARMNTIYDFSEDGTISMKFSLENNSQTPIKFNALFTALTCTSPTFNVVNMPQYLDLGVTPPTTSRDVPIYLVNGYASQIDTTNKLQLDIRFDRFNNYNNKRGCYILDATYYRKFYYGVVTNTRNVEISNIQFDKSLDFIVR